MHDADGPGTASQGRGPRVAYAVAACLLLAFGALWVAGSSDYSGPILVSFGRGTHGVHLADLLVVPLVGAVSWMVWRAMTTRTSRGTR